ncbi:hypothetical protein NGR_b13900 (plasmid) [Sinorhizobium fredii NGR234]|uniref:Uncharacterized protein n=1 Tax=Sinorhizobium fredii (strain NBRC 101917 / NGR234) TaxID=394 RepID=C3KRY3_SINFN|nr:hypothetical protein NGR_b13900 [Sinorhizobium fredii NGR234]
MTTFRRAPRYAEWLCFENARVEIASHCTKADIRLLDDETAERLTPPIRRQLMPGHRRRLSRWTTAVVAGWSSRDGRFQ